MVFLEKKCATCSIKPQKDLAPVMLVGRGKTRIVSSILSEGLIPSLVSLNPKKLTSSSPY